MISLDIAHVLLTYEFFFFNVLCQNNYVIYNHSLQYILHYTKERDKNPIKIKHGQQNFLITTL